MKQLGKNTELSTRVMATIGPVSSSMALIVAVRASRPVAIRRSMFSSTMMASSTTMPMASTSPNSVRLFRLKPSGRHDGERADQGDGHVDHGQDHGLPVLEEEQHDPAHQQDRDHQRVEHLLDGPLDERRGVVVDSRIRARAGTGFSAPSSAA